MPYKYIRVIYRLRYRYIDTDIDIDIDRWIDIHIHMHIEREIDVYCIWFGCRQRLIATYEAHAIYMYTSTI